MSLYWDSTYAIVLDLMAHYPDIDVDSVGLAQLHQMIISLPDFADEPQQVDDATLTDILVEWYEEVNI
ncbi:MAG: Fe-S cluster assembly protein IscX [Chloroflexota bacterium]